MKVAFLVFNHRGPEQLVRLLTTLRAQLPDSPLVVHHDVFHGELPSAVVEPVGNVHLLASGQRVVWGEFSMVDVLCWSLTWMREHLEFDWVVVLSGQDYPIKPLRGLADDLTANGADAVFGATLIDQMPVLKRMIMHRRYFFRYRPAAAGRLPGGAREVLHRATWPLVQALNILQPLFRIYRLTSHVPYRFGWRARNKPFNSEFPCWHAATWCALSRGALEYMLDYVADQPDYVDYYRGTMCADESMLASIVCNAPHLRVAHRHITYTRWDNARSAHPDTFRAADFNHLLGVQQYFARKFDIEVDATILDALDDFIAHDAPTHSVLAKLSLPYVVSDAVSVVRATEYREWR